jgi:sigma-B regulation protein RsbU (phosphoserine phosphatase)
MIADTQVSVHEELVSPTPHLRHLLADVDGALLRLESGTFGQCEECHDPIEEDRLRADPLARICLACLNEEESRALEQDLRNAAELQTALLPQRDLQAGGWDIHYRYQPLGPVSGDHCDLIQNGSAASPLYFLFGDVSGKGVSAALLMTQLQGLFRSLVTLDLPLSELMSRANRLFCESTLSRFFATLVVGRLHPDGRLEIVNAGHCPPLLARSDAVEVVHATGCPLGLFAKSTFEVREFALLAPDRLLLYTDGLSEATNQAGDEYGTAGLLTVLRGAQALSAEATLEACLADLEQFRAGTLPNDDMTVMVIRRQGA